MECPHGIPDSACSICLGKVRYGVSVWITHGGSAFHSHPDCEFIESGQQHAERLGHSTWSVEEVALGTAQRLRREPCLGCYPRAV